MEDRKFKKLLRETYYREKKQLGFTGKSEENNIKALVDKENVVILREETFNRDREIIFSTEVTEIEFNSEINQSFIKEYENLSKYTLIE